MKSQIYHEAISIDPESKTITNTTIVHLANHHHFFCDQNVGKWLKLIYKPDNWNRTLPVHTGNMYNAQVDTSLPTNSKCISLSRTKPIDVRGFYLTNPLISPVTPSNLRAT
jgi:hypothetical protein